MQRLGWMEVSCSFVTPWTDLLEASTGDKDDVGKFETPFNVQLLELAAGTFEGGDTPRINVEFTEDISTANLMTPRLLIAWLPRNMSLVAIHGH